MGTDSAIDDADLGADPEPARAAEQETADSGAASSPEPDADLGSDPDSETATDPSEAAGTPTAPGEASFEVRNCTNDHVVVYAGSRQLRLSPLGAAPVDVEQIATFALDELVATQVFRLSRHESEQSSVEAGGLIGFGFWAVIGYFIVLGMIDSTSGRLAFGVGAPLAVIIAVLVVLAVLKKRLSDVGQGLSIVFVLAVAAGVPIAALIVFGDLSFLAGAGNSAELFGRLAQTAWVVIASLVPTMLYFIFDRQRAQTIRRKFQQDILRLDSSVSTLYDIEAKYGDVLLETVGAEAGPRARASRANPYPIFIAAALIALGWLLVLPVVDPTPGVLDEVGLSTYFLPQREVYVYGFLGTYFFSITLIARRYVRGDLRPKTYGTISVRILTVFILSWVLALAFEPDDWLYVAAFLVGILPETFFTLISEGQRAVLGKIANAMREPHPLTKLEGIDLYDRSRLQDEGVNNVEALAHHDLVELMLATRIPVPRLVDWVDQAILYLHTVDASGTPIGHDHLRACGIRTASDLVTMRNDPELWKILVDGCSVEPKDRLVLVSAAIRDDEWMTQIKAWREFSAPGQRAFVVDESGNVHERRPDGVGPS